MKGDDFKYWAENKGCFSLILIAIVLAILAVVALPTPVPFDDIAVWGSLLTVLGVLTLRLLKLIAVLAIIIGIILLIYYFANGNIEPVRAGLGVP